MTDKTKAEKYPALWSEFTRLQARRNEIEAEGEPLRDQREQLRLKMDALNAEEAAINEQLKAQRPELTEIDTQLSGLAKAMGGDSTQATFPSAA